jgi:glutathione peroxidase-family protein
MKRFSISLLSLLLLAAGQQLSIAGPKIDQAAPDFKLTDATGKEHSLSDFKGKWVVLEWVNFGCPFVKKHYGSGNMQGLQKTYTGKDIIWLTICSSAPGKEGYYEREELNAKIKAMNANPTAYLIDADGMVGKMYEAKTTPHMFIVNPEGKLAYAGGIDNIASTDKDDIKEATNYVREALDAGLAGKAIVVKSTKPYGCSVKYK